MTEPPLLTEDLDASFFPPDQAAQPNEKGELICQIRAKVPNEGPAKWEYSDGPCNIVLKCGDSYRRHVILRHLGCSRGNNNRFITWIGE
jgi:hypothetical protein